MIVSEILPEIITSHIGHGMSYSTYKKMITALAANGQSTALHSNEDFIRYTKLNAKRMDRLDKTITITTQAMIAIRNFTLPVTWLVITESWCGDAAQSLPVMHKIALLNDCIDLKIILRDQNELLTTPFSIYEIHSIPKLIMIDTQKMQVLRTWGPRPSEATKMVAEFKAVHGKLTAEFKKNLQLWYLKNKGINIVEDLTKLLW